MRKMVEIKNLYKDYGDFRNSFRALDNVTLDIEKGEFIAIMGPSGAGKSTLLNLIATIDIPSKGDIFINGKRIKSMYGGELAEFRRENIGFIFQDCNLLDTLTLRDNILAPLTLVDVPMKEADEIVEKFAEKMGIIDILDKYPADCSGGEKQRAATCRALSSNPKIIVADEPTAALDSKNSMEFLSILEELNEKDKITIIMVTHNPIIASYCKRVVLIKDGKLEIELKKENKDQIIFYNDILKETSREVEAMLTKKVKGLI